MNISTEKVCDASSNLSSPIEDSDGYLYLVTQNGEVIKYRDGHMTVKLRNFRTSKLLGRFHNLWATEWNYY